MSALHGRRIGLLTASASRGGGGVFEAVVAQAAMIRALGGEAVIFALADEHSAAETDADRARLAPSAVHVHAVAGPAQIGYAGGMLASLLAADLDCLHLHGIWMYPSHAGARWARRTGRAYVISPHGMLDPWITARGRVKKAFARAGYERASWRAASAFHALNGAEAQHIRRESGHRQIVVIPNAAPSVASLDTASRPPHIVYIGRIHFKKNLLALVAAWRIATKPAGSRLTIAGWGEPTEVAALRQAIADSSATAQTADDIHFAGPIYGVAKDALLAQARFTILPSLSEGLPMAILEGWAAGAPAIMTAACNLPDGFAAGAALACTADPGVIAAVITQALHVDEPAWQATAAAARALAGGPFAAETVAARWAQAYGTVIAGAASPSLQPALSLAEGMAHEPA